MYRILLSLVLLGSVAVVYWLHRSGKLNLKYIWDRARELFVNIRALRDPNARTFLILSRLFYVLTSLFFLILASTGFLPILLFGGHLSGIMLIIHVTIAPFFAFSLMISVLLLAHCQQFVADDFIRFKEYFSTQGERNKSLDLSLSWNKILFWLFAVISLPAILSMIISMYPFIGTEGQNFLLNIHRYSVLFLFIIGMVHFFVQYPNQKAPKSK